jgi:VanZ family protein
VRSRLIDVALALGYAGLIFVLSAQSSFPVPKEIWTFDKILHGVEYGVFAFLVARAVRDRARLSLWPGAIAVICAILYGVGDEVHQSFVPGRSSDLHDVVADSAGAALGAVAFTFHTRRGFRVRRGT